MVTQEQRQYALSQLQAAMGLILSDHEKADFLHALQVAPQLVLTESDPVQFFRRCNSNSVEAARTLAQYWTRRRQVFGERAFLPMTLTGEGALSTEDIESLRTGMVVVLPATGATDRSFIFCNPSRGTSLSAETRLRLYFFVSQAVREKEDRAASDGYVCLFLVEDIALIGEALPEFASIFQGLQTKAWYFFDAIRGNQNNDESHQNFVAVMVHSFGSLFRLNQTYIAPRERAKQSLEFHGLLNPGVLLPELLGGSWQYKEFSDWISERVRTESVKELEQSKAASIVHENSESTQDYDLQESEDSKMPAKGSRERVQPRQGLSPEFDEAMRQLPQSETEAYSEALVKATPLVWEEESNPQAFLRLESSNAQRAVKRMAKYWQLRSSCFGSKQYRSLYQTGEDALGRSDLSVLGTGFLMLLPEDTEGSSVLFINASRFPRGPSGESRDRCLFYMFSLMAENIESQARGVVLLCQLSSPPFDRLDISFMERLAGCAPLRVKAVHLFSRQPPSDDVESLVTFCDETHLHVDPCPDVLSFMLQSFGLRKTDLPKCLNGDWGFEKFVHWQELRTRMEFRVPIGGTGGDRNEAFEYPAVRPYPVLPESEKTKRKQRMNVIHCRRKRDRQLIETAVLQERCAELEEEKRSLLLEGERLESLLRAANATLDRIEEETEASTSVAAAERPEEMKGGEDRLRVPYHAQAAASGSIARLPFGGSATAVGGVHQLASRAATTMPSTAPTPPAQDTNQARSTDVGSFIASARGLLQLSLRPEGVGGLSLEQAAIMGHSARENRRLVQTPRGTSPNREAVLPSNSQPSSLNSNPSFEQKTSEAKEEEMDVNESPTT